MADGQACSLNKNTTQYGRHFVFLARYIRLSVGASIFRFCFVYFVSFRFVSSFHSNFWLPWRVFPNTFLFVLFSMRRAYAARRRRRRDVITHRRRRRHRLSRNFTHRHRPFRALFSVYLHFESVRKKSESDARMPTKSSQDAALSSSSRRGAFSMPIMRKLRD